jgi:WD40 repeat protein
LIYAADGSFKQAKKKRFAGHTIAGYACNIGFSPDGKYISSGTGGGDVVFWDWKTGKIASRLRAHKEVVIDHAWLPNEHVSLVSCEIHGNGADDLVKGGHCFVGRYDQVVDIEGLQHALVCILPLTLSYH